MEPTEERRVLRLPASAIRPNPSQPRRVFEERGLRELAASIRRHGGLYVAPGQRLHETGRPENDNSPF